MPESAGGRRPTAKSDPSIPLVRGRGRGKFASGKRASGKPPSEAPARPARVEGCPRMAVRPFPEERKASAGKRMGAGGAKKGREAGTVGPSRGAKGSRMPPEELRRISEEIYAAYRPIEDPLVLRVMPTAPGRAHAYWNIPAQAVEEARREMGTRDSAAVLRVWGEDESGARSHVDFTISLAPRNWYFEVRFAPDRTVFAEIGLRASDGTFRPLARSDAVYLPRAVPGKSSDILYMKLTESGKPEFVEVLPPIAWSGRSAPATEAGAPGTTGAAGESGPADRDWGAHGAAAAREEAAKRLAAAALDDWERKRLASMIERGMAPRWEEEAGREARRLAAEAEKVRRNWPAWLRALTEREIEAFYERLREAGGAHGQAVKPGGSDPADAAASVLPAIEKFLEAARSVGAPLRAGLAERIAALAEAAARGDEDARRALLELAGRAGESPTGAPWRLYSSGP